MRHTDDSEERKRVYMDLYVIRKSNDCEYIVKCHGYIITYDHLYICMELMATCLEKLMAKLDRGLPEEIIGKVTVSVVKALNYLKETHVGASSNRLFVLENHAPGCEAEQHPH